MNKKRLSFIHSSGKIPVFVCLLLILGIRPAWSFNTYVERNPDSEKQYLFWSPQPGDSTLKYVANQDGTFQTLWVYAFHPTRSARLSEVKLFDVTGDGRSDIVALSRSVMGMGSEDDPWLLVFPAEDNGFSATPLSFTGPLANGSRVRATGFDLLRREDEVWMVVAEGTPQRRAIAFRLSIGSGQLRADSIQTYTSPLVASGYGQLYTVAIQAHNKDFIILFSAEANLLKTAVFPFAGGPALTETVLIAPSGARLIGPGLIRSDLNHDGAEEILIPFDNESVMTLEWNNKTLELNPADIINPFLWPGDEATLSRALADIQTLPEKPPATMAASAAPDTLNIATDFTDTLRLGDTLVYSTVTDSAASFYSFTWKAAPPRGVVFDPERQIIHWQPDQAQLGWHVFSFVSEEKTGEELISHDDEYGARLQLTPILKTSETTFAVVVLDTVTPDTTTYDSADFVQAEPRMFSLIVTTPTELANNRYQFEGESPFGIMVHESNPIPGTDKKLVGHNILADLNLVKSDASVAFRYFTPDTMLTHVTTLTIIHDFESNVMYMSVSPKMDSLPQSFSPESWDPHFYNYPEYFFEGFPSTMKMDSSGQALVFSFGESAAPQILNASVMMLSPINPNHWLSLYLKEGTLAEIRGEVKVKENLSQKVIVEMDLLGDFIPRLLTTRTEYAENPPAPPIPVTPIPLRLPQVPDTKANEALQEPLAAPDPEEILAAPDSVAGTITQPDSALVDSLRLPPATTPEAVEPQDQTDLNPLPGTAPSDTTVSDTTGQQ